MTSYTVHRRTATPRLIAGNGHRPDRKHDIAFNETIIRNIIIYIYMNTRRIH